MRGLVVPWACALALLGCGGTPAQDPVAPRVTATSTSAAPVTDAAAKPALFESDVAVATNQAPEPVAFRAALEWLVGSEWAAFVQFGAVRLPDGATSFDSAKRTVHVRLDADAAAALLERFETMPLAGRRPPAWAELLEELANQERGIVACARRTELLGQQCIPFEPEPFRLRVAGLAQRAVLQPLYVEGVPTDASGKPLRKAHVRVFESSDVGLLPVAGAPVAIEGFADGHRVGLVSSDDGEVTFEHPGRGSALSVSFDVDALLGPAGRSWNAEPLRVAARPLQHARTALVSTERARGASSSTATVQDAVVAELRRRWGSAVAPLPPPWDGQVRGRHAIDAKLAAAIADGLRGAFDYLLLVESDSEFASQMGQERVWFEARANVQFVELWTGRTLQRFSERLTASGIGEERAEAAARRDVGAKVAQRLVSSEAQRVGGTGSTEADSGGNAGLSSRGLLPLSLSPPGAIAGFGEWGRAMLGECLARVVCP